MGLDMYLYYRRNFSGWDPRDAGYYTGILGETGMSSIASHDSRSLTVEVTAIYWRKANAVHGWFVNELAGGVDECQRISVARDDLIRLREICKNALSVPAGIDVEDHAGGILPTQEGFFFGGTSYDENYLYDLARTITEIDKLLAQLPAEGEGWDWSLSYQASW